jgi:hypothetical protein
LDVKVWHIPRRKTSKTTDFVLMQGDDWASMALILRKVEYISVNVARVGSAEFGWMRRRRANVSG